MSDVYGCTCRKLKGDNNPEVTLGIWLLVNELCIAALVSSNNMSSRLIMDFLKKSLPSRKLLADLKRFHLTHRSESYSTLAYAKKILIE